jgi:hypothetical protein
MPVATVSTRIADLRAAHHLPRPSTERAKAEHAFSTLSEPGPP